MKACVYRNYGSPEVLSIQEVEKPVPKDDEVLIRIRATTVTAVDSIFRRGSSLFARIATGVLRPKNPVLGTEFAGDIESTGKDVHTFKVGDRVFGDSSGSNGTHAEYICLRVGGPLATVPSSMSYEEAASVSYAGLTALPFLRDTGSIQPGYRVLVIGASGSVGSFAVQLARHFGAHVTGVCSTANATLVKSLGADTVIDYTKEDITGSGQKFDIVFDTVGKSSFSQCKPLLREKGKYLTAVLGVPILLWMLFTSKADRKAIIAFTGLRAAADRARDLIFLKELIEAGTLKPVIDKRYPFERIAEAHRYVDTGHKAGSVVITI